VRSLFDPATDLGYFLVYTQTKSASTVEAYQEIQTILREMVQNQSVTDVDLAEAKQRIINSLVFEYETPFDAVRSRLLSDFYGYPPDYFFVTQKEIEKITLKDLQETLPKYFFPDRLKVVMVGQRDAVPGVDKIPGFVERVLDSE
jgi:predicted Zn-dependent peptidase